MSKFYFVKSELRSVTTGDVKQLSWFAFQCKFWQNPIIKLREYVARQEKNNPGLQVHVEEFREV